MRAFLCAAVAAASVLIVPAAAANTLTLICKCQNVVVNGDEQRGCARQSDRTVVIDLDAKTLQWSNGPGMIWPAIGADISADQIQAGIHPGAPRDIPGRLMITQYTISRVTGAFVEDGMGHTTDRGAPNVDFIVPAEVTGMCMKVDAPKF